MFRFPSSVAGTARHVNRLRSTTLMRSLWLRCASPTASDYSVSLPFFRGGTFSSNEQEIACDELLLQRGETGAHGLEVA